MLQSLSNCAVSEYSALQLFSVTMIKFSIRFQFSISVLIYSVFLHYFLSDKQKVFGFCLNLFRSEVTHPVIALSEYVVLLQISFFFLETAVRSSILGENSSLLVFTHGSDFCAIDHREVIDQSGILVIS